MESNFEKSKRKIVHIVKEKILLCKFYSLKGVFKKSDIIVAVFDGKRKAMGLADRLKGIISLYAYCKVNNKEFRCDFTYPFDLETFLVPNKYNWILQPNEKSSSIFDTRILILHGETAQRLLSNKSKKQIHTYINRDYLEDINRKYQKSLEWGELFNELFKPSKALEEKINFQLNEIGSPYIACQLRFMALLGDFKEYDQLPLPEKEQNELINRCTDAILKLKNQNSIPILVVSDSIKFVKHISQFDGIKAFPEETVHIDCVVEKDDNVFMKPFLDIMLISKADKVFNIVSKGMYPSDFPFYASKINNKSFERIVID
jgi:hypothetical protein